jgi:hypothetical protein
MAQNGTAGGVNVSGSQGVQAGTGNVQNNYHSPPGPSFLRTMSPHKAIAKLRAMPHDDAVSALASALPGDVTEVLKVMVKADTTLAVALLADINPSTVVKLIEAIPEPPRWLQRLPDASAGIGDRAAELRWDRDLPGGNMEIAIGDSKYSGSFFRKYESSLIWWGDGTLITVDGAIADAYEANGGPHSELGLPQSVEYHTSLDGTPGAMQNFQHGTICTSEHGAYAVYQPIFDAFMSYVQGSSQWTWGWIGFPIADVEVHEGNAWQRFEHGTICSSELGVFPVRAEVVARTLDEWALYIATSEEINATPSPRGTTGTLQRFRDPTSDDPMVAYSSDKHRAQVVEGQFLLAHDRHGGTGGWLGFPTSGGGFDSPDTGWQEFEGGIIYVRQSGASFAVPHKTLHFITLMRAEEELGWPVSEEYVLGDGADRVQFFENGAFTRRNGKSDLLVRREKPAKPQGETPKVTAAELRARKAGWGGPVLTPAPANIAANREVSPRTGTAVPRAIPRAVPSAVPPAVASGTLAGPEEE